MGGVTLSQVIFYKESTHVFVSETKSEFQFINITGSSVCFSQQDSVGEAKTVLLSERRTGE